MARMKKVVTQHLEQVSGKLFETYPEAIKEFIRGKSGIYALYRRDKLYYVGLAQNLIRRLKTHTRDRHRNKWDRFSVYLTVHDDHMKELESLLLRIVDPAGNKQSGKFIGSTNLLSSLNKRMRELDADRRALLIGGRVAKRRRRAKTKKAKGSLPLAGVVERRIPLRAWHKKWEYRATLRRDGKIRYGSTLYDSPTSAAQAITKTRRNGWRFWHYRSKNGEWVPLAELRQ